MTTATGSTTTVPPALRRGAAASRSSASGRRRLLLAGAAVIALVTVAGCGGSGDSETAGGGGATSGFDLPSSVVDEGKSAADGAAPGTPTAGGTAVNGPVLDDRSIIRTGTLRLQSDHVEQAALDAAAAARSLGGLVSGEQTVTDPSNPDRTVADLTLRVPSARFDDLLLKVRGLGTVLSQTQQAEDVTGQVADVDARVEAQRASVRRIQALLARADTIGQVVTIEGQLAQRQADLESLEAQQKALKDQTALATLQVSVVGPDPAVVAPEDQKKGFLAGLDQGWHAFTVALTAGLTAVGALLPFVGFGLLILLPVLAWVRSRSRQATPPPAAPYEPPVREDQPVG